MQRNRAQICSIGIDQMHFVPANWSTPNAEPIDRDDAHNLQSHCHHRPRHLRLNLLILLWACNLVGATKTSYSENHSATNKTRVTMAIRFNSAVMMDVTGIRNCSVQMHSITSNGQRSLLSTVSISGQSLTLSGPSPRHLLLVSTLCLSAEARFLPTEGYLLSQQVGHPPSSL